MARRQSLREFQERLTARLAERTRAEVATRLGLRAGDASWIVDLTEVTEVIPPPPLTRVPHARSWFMGVTNIRGTLVGVVDWARFNGFGASATNAESRLLVLHPRFGVNVALLVERTLGLKAAARFAPDDSPGDAPNHGAAPQDALWLAGVLRDDTGARWRVLDISALALAPEFLDIAHV
jgi:twitching motility protein PilI